jgi:hypothetical protein
MSPDRRTFLKRSAAVVSAAMIADGNRLSGAEQARTGRPAPLDPRLLRAVGEAVLPESLGAAGRERAIVVFETWWREFKPNAELVHPYGGWVIPYGPPDREPEWSAQLLQLDQLSTARWGTPFRDRPLAERRDLLGELITDEGPGFPEPARAEHVAVALMAHYFASPEAVNRCYGVAIDPMSCRTTTTAGQIPPPIE